MSEQHYYDQTPVTLEFTIEEHDLLNSIFCHAMDAMDMSIPCIYDLASDSEIRQRYEMLDNMKDRSYDLWTNRFTKNS